MKKCSLFAVLSILIISFSAIGQETPVDDDDVVRISTNLVQIDMTVFDKKGRLLTDIKKNEVEVWQNGEKQSLVDFRFVTTKRPPAEKAEKKKNEELPQTSVRLGSGQVRRTIALVVDDLNMSFPSTSFVRDALNDFINNQMLEGDLVAIIRTGGGIGALQQFTSDKNFLRAAVKRIRFRPNGQSGISTFEPVGRVEIEAGIGGDAGGRIENDEGDLERFRNESFVSGSLGALNFVVNGMKELPGRKSVMFLSDGFAINRRDANGLLRTSRALDALKRLILEANRASVVVNTIDARGLQTAGYTSADNFGNRSIPSINDVLTDRREQLFETQSGLYYLAKETGGISIRNRNDIDGSIRKVLDQQGYYLIAYEPDEDSFDAKNPAFNTLEIKVNRKGTKVRYRSGFFGVSDEQLSENKNKDTAEGSLVKAIASPFGKSEIPLSVSALFVGKDQKLSKITNFVHIDTSKLDFQKVEDKVESEFLLLIMAFGENGTPVAEKSQKVTVSIKENRLAEFNKRGITYSFSLSVKKPGPYQIRVAVTDPKSKKIGSANQFLQIPKLKRGRIGMTDIAVDGVALKDWNGGNVSTTSNNVIRDTVLSQFKSGSIIRYTFDALNPKTKGGVSNVFYRSRIILDNKIIYEGKDQKAKGSGKGNIPISGALVLPKSFLPGTYILQIVVTDKNTGKKTTNNSKPMD